MTKTKQIKKTNKNAINWWLVAGCGLLAEGVGFASNMLCGDVKGFYSSLLLPPLSPPGWVFGVVWSVLYLVMGGVAGWLICLDKEKYAPWRKRAITWYWWQLLVNFCWSPVFFGLKNFTLAIMIVLVLVAMNFWLTYCIGKIDKKVAWLTVPYLCWLVFAAYLTVGVGMLNMRV